MLPDILAEPLALPADPDPLPDAVPERADPDPDADPDPACHGAFFGGGGFDLRGLAGS